MAGQKIDIENLKSKIITSSGSRQMSDRTNVRFLGIVDNISDFLSRHVFSVSPRAISFQQPIHSNRRAQFSEPGKIESEPLNIQLAPDDEGICETIIMAQILKQKGIDVSGLTDEGGSPRFDIKVEYYNTDGEVANYDLYKRCYIQSFDKGEYNLQSGMGVNFNLTIAYDELRYGFVIENEDTSFMVN